MTGPAEAGHDHRSRWPVVAAGGAGLLYAGLAAFALGAGTGYLPAIPTVGVAAVGAVVVAVALFGWLDEAFLSARVTGDGKPLYLRTMRLFLYTDVATFATGFVVYFYLRLAAWAPAEVPHLLSPIVAVNTLLLVASSGTFHLAASALDDGNARRFRGLMGLTLLLGVVFLGGQAFEYVELLGEGFAPGGGAFAAVFYGLTGLHGLHVALGALLIGIVLFRALRDDYGPERDTSVETVELYWHFVDGVWLFLVATVYVGATL
ncbi:cytochrome c oxidase subunit 3 [Halosegnis marinus]|uniref:Heme-copper oxidase subunit III n=2 Tax=Halosegnis marinus TaxID=3034023 RepID=A0ABD5ZPJ1_9EURY|nr:heme-copper oxidase subunit III [Halosegnis sp. DT85]